MEPKTIRQQIRESDIFAQREWFTTSSISQALDIKASRLSTTLCEMAKRGELNCKKTTEKRRNGNVGRVNKYQAVTAEELEAIYNPPAAITIEQHILSSSYYNSGEIFRLCDIVKITKQPEGEVLAVLQSMVSDGRVCAQTGKSDAIKYYRPVKSSASRLLDMCLTVRDACMGPNEWNLADRLGVAL